MNPGSQSWGMFRTQVESFAQEARVIFDAGKDALQVGAGEVLALRCIAHLGDGLFLATSEGGDFLFGLRGPGAGVWTAVPFRSGRSVSESATRALHSVQSAAKVVSRWEHPEGRVVEKLLGAEGAAGDLLGLLMEDPGRTTESHPLWQRAAREALTALAAAARELGDEELGATLATINDLIPE